MIHTFIKNKIIERLRTVFRDFMPNDVICRIVDEEDPTRFCIDNHTHKASMFNRYKRHGCPRLPMPNIRLSYKKLEYITDSVDHGNKRANAPIQFFREFIQNFQIDIFAENRVEIEKYATTTIAIILIDMKEIIADYNAKRTTYTATRYSTTYFIDDIHYLKGIPSTQKYELYFMINGRMEINK